MLTYVWWLTFGLLTVPVGVALVAVSVVLPEARPRLVPEGVALVFYGLVAAGLASAVVRVLDSGLRRWLGEIEATILGDRANSLVPLPRELSIIRATYLRWVERAEERTVVARAAAATIVHDLKAPIVGVRNVVRHLDDVVAAGGDLDPGLLRRLADETDRLAEQASAAVQRSREGEAEALGPVADIALRDLVDHAVARCSGTAVSFVVNGQAQVRGDRELMARALMNLVENAARYARSTVHVDIHPGLVRIADDGPGLRAPLERIVRPFVSVGDLDQGGQTGLGLAMADRVFRAHGGHLQVERTDDRGTVLLAYLGAARGAGTL